MPGANVWNISWGGCRAALHWVAYPSDGIDPGLAIRCLDCKQILCPRCAKNHFNASIEGERKKGLDAMLIEVPTLRDEVQKWKARCLAAEAGAEVTKCCFCENVDGPTIDLCRDDKNPGVASPYCMNCVRELVSQGDRCEKVSEVLLRSATLATKMLTKNAEDLATLRAAARRLVAAFDAWLDCGLPPPHDMVQRINVTTARKELAALLPDDGDDTT